MSFEGFLEQLELEDKLEQASRTDQARDYKAYTAYNGFGGFDYLGSRLSYSRKAREPYASESSHGHGRGDRRGVGGRDYETHSGDEPFPGDFGDLRAEGRSGNSGPRTQSGPFNYYGPARRHTGYSSDDPANFGQRDHGHRASLPPRRSELSPGEPSTAHSSLAGPSSGYDGGGQDSRSQVRDDGYYGDDSFGGSNSRTGHGRRRDPARRRD